MLESAQKEFVLQGYHDSSMRIIAKNAGVTTGAIYRYYPNKDSLFLAVTKSAVESFYQMYDQAYDQTVEDAFQGISYTEKSNKQGSQSSLAAMYDLIYEQFDKFYLLANYSHETIKGSFLQELVERETKTWIKYIEILKNKYNSNYVINKNSLHIICEVYIKAIFEPICHKMDKETAIAEATFFRQFFIDGCLGIEKIIKNN
ncbi:TetR/AcrR family transcriptional regulator [Lachnotalea glycerini]|uniref:TetR/AcrR family transcriptional regulator n=1 Tax=Lachnotalea glycerini TaxID=1763509 RepID=UPI00241F75A4|nr:TetR/AcrR family transcriptional regulator [Lachnotalea glycerini]